MMIFLCQAKYAIPALISLSAFVTYLALDLLKEFEPMVVDTLQLNGDDGNLFLLAVPPALTGDFEAQMAPMDIVLELLESSSPFHTAALAAAESFANTNSSSSNSVVSVASPVECSLQLYRVDMEIPPTPDDMWTARCVVVATTSFAETQQLAMELQNQSNIPVQAIQFGPGPFVTGYHSIVQNQDSSFLFRLLTTYWIEELISLHWQTFDYQDKFVVLRILVMAKNADDDITYLEHVIMKADSLDVYETIHPNHE